MLGWLLVALAGGGLVIWGAEAFAEHLALASARLGLTTFALAVLLAGAEPEELATVVTAAARDVPGIALGDVVGANVAMCTVALGVGALLAPLPFTRGIRRYGIAALVAGTGAVAAAWDGRVGRAEAVLLVASYAAFVGVIWRLERRPPAIGEVGELEEMDENRDAASPAPDGAARALALVLLGVLAMAGGATVLVEAIRRVSHVEETQVRLGLVVVGFATAFELVVLAWSSVRRDVPEALVAAGLGSFTYNATMTLGAGGLVRPLRLVDAGAIRVPGVSMLAALLVVVLLGWRGRLDRGAGVVLLASYVVWTAAVLLL